MNQIKIGKFISECRKEKKLTQSQLAEKMNITDKAVSKWENGKSLPDISLLLPLCEILGISLNELFIGEHIPNDKLKEKTDEVLLDMIDNKKGQKFITTICSIVMSIGIVLFFIPSIYKLEVSFGIAITAIGLLLLMVGLYGKIRYPRPFK